MSKAKRQTDSPTEDHTNRFDRFTFRERQLLREALNKLPDDIDVEILKLELVFAERKHGTDKRREKPTIVS